MKHVVVIHGYGGHPQEKKLSSNILKPLFFQ
jgi:hypothetical protein